MEEEPDRVAMVSDLRKEVGALRTELSRRIGDLDARVTETNALIKSEAEATRRHFDIMVEKMDSSVRLVAEGQAHHTVVLDDHETRIKLLDRRRT